MTTYALEIDSSDVKLKQDRNLINTKTPIKIALSYNIDEKRRADVGLRMQRKYSYNGIV